MPIAEIRPDGNRQLQEIADVLAKSKKVVVITGAGISTNIGIPVRKQGSVSILVVTNKRVRTFGQRMAFML
jgi:adenosylcobinamide amidohydrolase